MASGSSVMALAMRWGNTTVNGDLSMMLLGMVFAALLVGHVLLAGVLHLPGVAHVSLALLV